MSTKSGTVLERVVWMTRTSDVLGSHMKTDLESYLTLIRRKIQEKCATTAELIAQIRRFKIGESAHVTPNEFRYTLIKFGIILPQVLVDRIFNVFDSDRSGTMDFDEFATWIMNSEFRPAVKTGKGKLIAQLIDTPQQILQKKLKTCIDQYPRVFRDMKEQVSFLEFISEVNRVHMPLTEKEARNIFQLLDPKDDGFVLSSAFVIWATTGRIEHNNRKKDQDDDGVEYDNLSLEELRKLIFKVIGRNTRQLENSFAHIKLGQGTKLPFEEFRRCLLNGGVGKNLHDMKCLFLALGGRKEGLADVDLFFNNLSPILSYASTEISAKRAPTAEISTSRADRRLRDALRKCFKEVKSEIEGEDRGGVGYIAPEKLYRILVKRCMALSFEDFRFIVQEIKKEPNSNRIDYYHFLHSYNPSLSHHQLAGLSTLRNYVEETPLSPLKSSSYSGKLTGGTGGMIGMGGLSSSLPTSLSASFLQPRPMTSSLSSASPVAAVAGASQQGGLDMETPELRKIWQGVLRECHRGDPERSGQIKREAFIAALEKADVAKTMSPESMSRLADSYLLSNGLVNYLLLFRSYLSDLTRSPSAAPLARMRSLPALNPLSGAVETTGTGGAVHPWDFTYHREKHPDHPYWQQATANPRSDNNYTDPSASTSSLRAMQLKLSLLPPGAERGGSIGGIGGKAGANETAALLAQHSNHPVVLSLCHKCYHLFLPHWREIRQEMKKLQIQTQKGAILTTHFLSILEGHGIRLTKGELGLIVKHFRGLGMQDIVRFDDFLKVCMLVKDMVK